ncbi:MAG: hypothetical protein IJO06_13960 [Thermoguttaceae bacterium]|nr:hypothetical protein [Thermoguttaceae bacterium]
MADDAKKQFSKLKSAFTKRLKTLFAETLEPLGFALAPGKRQRWERPNVATPQICAFTYDNYASAFYLEYNYYFTLSRECWANAPCDAETQETLDRFFRSFESGDSVFNLGDLKVLNWSPRSKRFNFAPNSEADVDKIFARVEAQLRYDVVPFLQRFHEPGVVLNDYDAGDYERRVQPSRDEVRDFFTEDFFIDGLSPDLYLACARFQVGQYAEAATHFELAAEKALANDSWTASLAYWRLYAKAMQIGALSVRKTIEKKGPGPTPPRPKRCWRELDVPPELANYPNRNQVYRLLENAASPYEVVASRALKALETLKAEEAKRRTSEAQRDAASEERQKEVERRRLLFYPTPDEKKTLEYYKKELKKRFREKAKELLAPKGFAKTNSSATDWRRETETLRHYCWFSFHNGYGFLIHYAYALKPDFSIWENAPQDAETQGVIDRWQEYVTESYATGSLNGHKSRSWDIPTNDEEFATSLTEIDKVLSDEAFPFFERFRETSDVLRAVDAGEVHKRHAIAEDPGWNLCYLATLRFQAGQIDDAASCLRELVDQSPNDDRDWEKLRAEAARVGLLSLEKTLARQGASLAQIQPTSTQIPESLALCSRPEIVRSLLEDAAAPCEETAANAKRRLADAAAYLRRLPEILAQHLEPQGFRRLADASTVWVRETETLVQRCGFEVEPFRSDYFHLCSSYGFKLDFAPWANIPDDAESQETFERMKTVVVNRLAPRDLQIAPWINRVERRRDDEVEVVSVSIWSSLEEPEPILKFLDASFTKEILPFFDRWRESGDVLSAFEADEVTADAFGYDAATQNFAQALFLFQAGRYKESANRFAALAKSKRRPKKPEPRDKAPVVPSLLNRFLRLDDADWAALQEGARLAVASVREIAKERKVKK